MRGDLPALVCLVSSVLLVPASAQVLPEAVVETAHVQLTPPFLLRPVPGTTIDVPVKVWGTLECSGAQPEDLQVYVAAGKAFTESNSSGVRDLWHFEPEFVNVPWRASGDRYAIDTDAVFRLVSTDAPTVDRESAFRVATVGTGRQSGTCPGGHVVWATEGQGAIVMKSPEQITRGPAAPATALVTVLSMLAACAVARRRHFGGA